MPPPNNYILISFQILASYKSHQMKESGAFDWKFAMTRVLAVDESSMVSIEVLGIVLSVVFQT